MKHFIRERWEDLGDYLGGGSWAKWVLWLIVIYLVIAVFVGMYWSDEPDTFDVRAQAQAMAKANNEEPVVGYTFTATAIHLGETLLNKPGGYVSNDILPPGVWLDNMPSWEFGVLVTLRDVTRAMRSSFSRSQSQSTEDPDLTVAEPQFHFDSDSWAIPATESEYRRGLKALRSYLHRLSDSNQSDAQFYARADNLRVWLADVETRLGSLSRRLSESVGKRRMNEALAGEPAARQSTTQPESEEVKTPWTQIDNTFYEARGTAFALLHLLRAVEVDFREVLRDKNAMVSLQQIIIELEGTQHAMWSPVILNGSGFGIFANHSLTMASYLSRANAAMIELRELLSRG
ncbi:DUF2333 family protein [Marinobacteraceae bacterium S3BR75-40.1]